MNVLIVPLIIGVALLLIATALALRQRLLNRPRSAPLRCVSKEHLAVVGPRVDCTEAELKQMGATLRGWLTRHDYARQVYDLEQLEAGERPRILAPHCLKIEEHLPPETLEEMHLDYWSVALLVVAEDTDEEMAGEEMAKDLEGIHHLLAVNVDADYYYAWTG